MLQNMIDAVDNGIFEDDFYLSLVSFVVIENRILLTFELTYENDDNVLQKWEVECIDFGEHKLDVSFFSDYKVFDEHVYLWDYNEDFYELYFNGYTVESKKIIGELYILHRDLTGGLIPFGTYINGNVEWLLAFNTGLMAKAPEHLVKDYAKVLESNGFKISLLPSKSNKQWNGKKNEYRVFIFGDSYVVAKGFNATQLA